MDTGTVLAITIPTLAVLVGMLVNNRSLGSLGRQIDSAKSELREEIGSVRIEIAGLRTEMDARFEAARQQLLRVEGVLDARLQHLEQQ